jgi:hypothetical protein
MSVDVEDIKKIHYSLFYKKLVFQGLVNQREGDENLF